MAAVAVVAHALVTGLPWAAAFALGAVVSPTDPLAGGRSCAASGCRGGSSAPSRARACSTTPPRWSAYKVAVAAVVGGSFSLGDAGLRFVAGAAGGIAIGLAVGWIIAVIRERTTTPR